MTYADIIRDNCSNHSPVSWWPRFAFHFTDVTNAVSILDSGMLYSRATASELNIMANDNASRQVIDMTNSEVKSKARFYFRPLTPTQYYNEGYKHPALRFNGDENANVPVPVFFLFNLEKLLSIPGVEFSEIRQAGSRPQTFSGVEAFSTLNFDFIYDNSYENFERTKAFRHAEITHPNALPIDSCINSILCRSSLERATLLNLLREKNYVAFAKYKDIIKVFPKDTFENNGLYISNCSFFENALSISFADTYNKRRYIERMLKKTGLSELNPISVTVWLKWMNTKKTIHKESIELLTDIIRPQNITIKKLPFVPKATTLCVEIYFDEKLVCYSTHPLESSELLK